MGDKQKVYLRGSVTRGAEVIKALTDLGAINSNHYRGDDNHAYYYINPDGGIGCAIASRNEVCRFLQEFYKEIELPEIKKWKDGDLLVRNYEGKKEYIVYSDEKSEIDCEIVLSYVYANDNVCYANVAMLDNSEFKAASKDDIKCFQELLHKHGKEWDFESKKLIDWRWKPEINKDYWYINDIGEVCRTNYNKLMPNNDYRIEIGNYFQTKDDAFSARDRFKEILLNK